MSLVSSTEGNADLELLRDVAVGGDYGRGPNAGAIVQVVVSGCRYSCCGRGWQQRVGYEQTYRGYVDNLHAPAGEAIGTFMLYSMGVGTLSYVVAVTMAELEAVERVD